MYRINVGLVFILVALFARAECNKVQRVAKDILSNEDPGTEEYDHEAFLGEDVAEMFDDLIPEESIELLGVIYDKIDADNDQKVTEEELQKWILRAQERFLKADTAKRIQTYDLDKNSQVAWEEYYDVTFGKLKEEDWATKVDGVLTYNDVLARDKNRWRTADVDGDGVCSSSEIQAFFYPQHFDHMKDSLFNETMTDLDKNNDGFIDIDEYMSDVYKPENEEEEEPEWVASDKEQFKSERDEDGDGKLNEKEIRDWIMPSGHDASLNEAKHLIKESDSDKDGVLTKKEVQDHYNTFVGSQATDWGEMFERHDEF